MSVLSLVVALRLARKGQIASPSQAQYGRAGEYSKTGEEKVLPRSFEVRKIVFNESTLVMRPSEQTSEGGRG